MFKECLYRYLKLFVSVDGSVFQGLPIIRGLSAHIRWIVRRSGSTLGWFASSGIVFSIVVCRVFSGLSLWGSGFLDGGR